MNYNANNQVNWTSATGTGFNYDAAGDVIGDAQNSYAYDGEGRLCAVKNSNVSIYQYVYDAEGHRVARGSQTSLSCPVPTGAGFTLQSQYLLDSGGDQVTELNSSGTWQHTNAFAGGILATYSTTSIPFAFHLTDPLGSRRVLANAQGVSLVSCQSLPFGDGETCTPTPTEQLFTGKERDAESGNDYFLARYDSSAVGRFLSPDPGWSKAVSAGNPQSWNLYAYTENNPLTHVDPDGMAPQCFLVATTTVSYFDWSTGKSSKPQTSYSVVGPQYDCPNPNQGPSHDVFGDFYNINSQMFTNMPAAQKRVAPNNAECDNACQLAHAFNKTGVYSIKNPCFIGGFYAASAVGAVAAGDTLAAGEIGEAGTAIRTAAQASKTLQAVDRAKWWLGAVGVYAVVEGKATQAWNWATGKVASGCNAMQ